MTISNAKNAIDESMRIFIFPHILPDGDTTGASYAIASHLRTIGKEVTILTEGVIPANLNLIPSEFCKEFNEEDYSRDLPDLVISVDSSDTERLGKRIKIIDLGIKLINIDHHKTNIMYGDINIVDPDASSTSEIVFKLLKQWEHNISVEEATALYIGISTDTGSFKYSNTTPETMIVASELMKAGIDINNINTELYQNQPLKKIRLMLSVLDTLVIETEYKYARIVVTHKMLEDVGATYEDIDGLVEFVRNIEDIEVVSLFKQTDDLSVNVSMRSKHDFDVSKIAFANGGGGHTKAAGCVIEGNLENAIMIIDGAIKGGV